MANTTNAKPTQDYIPINEIRDRVVVLKDKTLCAVLMVSSLNFALKSSEEQIAIIEQFQNFLNTLDFSVQFTIQSRELDIRPYIALLTEELDKQTNDLMRVQTREYIQFIETFTENMNIMKKSFFVIVPYTPALLKKETGLKGLFASSGTKGESDGMSFDEYVVQLEQRIAVVEQGLIRSGIKAVRLGNEELTELFYRIFNPGDLGTPAPIE